MDGIHDLGGMQGFGPVPRGGAAEQSFHVAWQPKVFGLALAGRLTNVDAFRHAIERVDPVTYLTAGYWGRWLHALERLAAEFEAGALPPAGEPSAHRDIDTEPRFAVGDRVRVREERTDGHTRLPGYVRGRCGVVVAHQGAWVFPDTHAHGGGECPSHVYAVRFDGRELWADTAEPGTAVHVDLFEPYLESEDAAAASDREAAT